jgi:hypothetical protein
MFGIACGKTQVLRLYHRSREFNVIKLRTSEGI